MIGSYQQLDLKWANGKLTVFPVSVEQRWRVLISLIELIFLLATLELPLQGI